MQLRHVHVHVVFMYFLFLHYFFEGGLNFFYARSCLPSKVVFLQRSSFVKGCLPVRGRLLSSCPKASPEVRHSSSTRHFHQNHHVVLVVSWSNCQNFNLKFNFKQLCPLKSQNPTYGSQVMAIWNKMRCPPPSTRKLFCLVVTCHHETK